MPYAPVDTQQKHAEYRQNDDESGRPPGERVVDGGRDLGRGGARGGRRGERDERGEEQHGSRAGAHLGMGTDPRAPPMFPRQGSLKR